MDTFRKFISNYSNTIISVTILLTIFFIYSLKNIKVENVSDKFGLPHDDKQKIDYENFNEMFGNDEFIIVAIESDSVLSKNIFELVHHLTMDLNKIENVDSVLSLSNIPFFTSSENNIITSNTIPIYDYYLKSNKELSKILSVFKETELINGRLISKDLKCAAIYIYINKQIGKSSNSNKSLKNLLSSIENRIENYDHGLYKFHIAGSKLIDLELQNTLAKDIKLFILLSFILSLIILFNFLRNWKAVLISITTAFLAVIWSLGVISIAGIPISLSLSMIIPIVFMSSIEYSIHYLFFIFNESSSHLKESDLIPEIIRLYLKPNLLSGFTTVIGFLSLVLSRLEAIQEVGLYISFGILFCIFMNNVFLLSILNSLSNIFLVNRKFTKSPASGISIATKNLVLEHSKTIIFVSTVLLVIGLIGILNLKSDTNHLKYVDEDTDLRRSYQFLDEKFGGTLPIEIVIHNPIKQRKNLLEKIASVKLELIKESSVGSIISPSDYLDYISKQFPGNLIFFGNQNDILIYLAKDNYLKNWINLSSDSLYLRINCLVKVSGSHELEILLTKFNNTLSHYFNSNQYKIVGLVSYLISVNKYITESFINSFAVAFLIVFTILFLLSQSIRLGILVVLSNTIPIILIMAVMGWFNIYLDISTVMIASILIGITVNDTIFFVYRFKSQLKENQTVENAISISFNTIGSPIIITSVVLAVGFFVMIFSNFIPTRLFGLLSGMIIIFALISDLLLLPSLIKYFGLNIYQKKSLQV
ncbi:MAG: MMPL family transporter [Ignavibacteriaceae bacterium]